MLQILGRIALGFLSLDGLLRDHAEVMDERGAGHGSGKSGLFRAPEEIDVFTTAVHEPFVKKSGAIEDFASNEHAGPAQSPASRSPAGGRELRRVAVQFIIQWALAHGGTHDTTSCAVHETQERRQPSHRDDDVVVQNPHDVATAGANALIPRLGASEIHRVRNDPQVMALEIF